MSKPERSPIAEIVDAITDNRLTVDEMERRLSERIDAEYEKGNQADIRLINACEDLLGEMRGECAASFASHKADYHQCIDAALAQEAPAPAPRKRPLRVAAAAAVLVCALVIGGIASLRWLNGYSTNDQQQYTVQGHEVTLAAIRSCIAGNINTDWLVTTDFDEVTTYLGFEPIVPTVFLSGWNIQEYSVAVTRDRVIFSASYYAESDSSDNSLLFRQTYFAMPGDAYLAFEQNEEGNYVTIADTNVYITENVDRISFSWCNENSTSVFSGNIMQEDGLNLIAKLIGGS